MREEGLRASREPRCGGFPFGSGGTYVWTPCLFSTLVMMLVIVLAACGERTPAPPSVNGGTYTSAKFHFSITYPDGWQPHEINGPSATATIPLTVILTRTGAASTAGALISTFTATVLNAHDPTVANAIVALQEQAKLKNSPLRRVTLAGQQALQGQPVQQQFPNSTLSGTHTDYYIFLKDYEYQLSTDAITGDHAESALQSMLESFTLTK